MLMWLLRSRAGGTAARTSLSPLCNPALQVPLHSARFAVHVCLPPQFWGPRAAPHGAAPLPRRRASPLPPPGPARPPAGKASKEGGSGSPENNFINAVIALHDKYTQYVSVSRSFFFSAFFFLI